MHFILISMVVVVVMTVGTREAPDIEQWTVF